MTFEALTSEACADPHYSQIFIQVGGAGNSAGNVIDLIDSLGGDVVEIKITACEDGNKILRIRLGNELVNGIVLELIQQGYLKTTGFSRAFCSDDP